MTDPLANKNLIYQGRDGIVAIGYAGKAYGLNRSNSNMPTDEWIAEKLWGQPIMRGPDNAAPVTLSFQRIAKHLYIGEAIKLLQTELTKSFNALPKSQRKRSSLHIAVVGWRESRQGIRYVLTQIVKKNETFKIECAPRYYLRTMSRRPLLSFPEGYISFSDLLNIGDQLKNLTPDECESLFVTEIQRVSGLHPDRVGPHCLSILVPRQPSYPVRVRFIPNVEHTALVEVPDRGISRTVAVAFSPWVIGPGVICAPAVIRGSSTLQMSPFTIVLEAPTGPGVTGLRFSQQRPPSGS